MKGMLSKAFSLALLISVVPSFAMNAKAVAEKAAEEVPAEVALVVNAGQQMADASSATTTVRNNVVSAGITIAAPTVWDKMKHYADVAKYYANNMYTSAANSSAAGYAHAALVAPFNYTAGALATKFGLADRVPSFVKNDSYYSSTMAKYAFGLAAMYAGYKSVKAVYNYMTTPAEKKAEVVKPVVAQTPAPVAKAEKASEFFSEEHEQVVKALHAVLNKVLEAKTPVADSQEMVALGALPYMQKIAPKSKQSYAALVSNHVTNIDNVRFNTALQVSPKDQAVRVSKFVKAIETIKKNAKTFFAPGKAANKLNTQVQNTLGFATRAYNALVNRYTLGAATVAGLGYAGYKYGVPYYNKTK